jgi:hypothetical protein
MLQLKTSLSEQQQLIITTHKLKDISEGTPLTHGDKNMLDLSGNRLYLMKFITNPLIPNYLS